MFFIAIFLPRFKAQWSSVSQCCKLPMVAAMRSNNGCVSLRPNKSCWGCSLQSFYMRDLECMVKDTSCWWLLQIKYLCNRRCQKSAGIQRLSILQVQFLCLWPCIFKRYTCFLVMFFNLSSIAFCLKVFYSAGTNSGLMLFAVFWKTCMCKCTYRVHTWESWSVCFTLPQCMVEMWWLCLTLVLFKMI